MYKLVTVVMLPTNQKAQIGDMILFTTNTSQKLLCGKKRSNRGNTTYQHLYILSNDKIEEGDLVMYTGDCITKSRGYLIANSIYYADSQSVTGGWYFRNGKTKDESNTFIDHYNGTKEVKKIIASTDPTLNLPSPSPEFIQVYCEKQPKEIMVKYKLTSLGFEDVLVVNNNQISIRKVKQSYTREEVVEMMTQIMSDLNNYISIPGNKAPKIEDYL